jgi:hypothetical protein
MPALGGGPPAECTSLTSNCSMAVKEVGGGGFGSLNSFAKEERSMATIFE